VRQELLSKRAGEIRGMFGRIAHRYDLLNRLLSLGQDVRWRRLVARRIAESGADRVLDVCAGTGDLAICFEAARQVYGSDFCLPMLALARQKTASSSGAPAWFAADALQLPVATGSFDAVTVAFGIRNFEDLERGLAELVRVLDIGGRLIVLEFSQPRGTLAPVMKWWVRQVPPLVGRIVSGDAEAYRYLTTSVEQFPDGERLMVVLRNAGLDEVEARPLTGGVATLYEGTRR
jgi:demethylmenaquinone methyltransferase/2-methoxy-6-polyprenyl-1,4-benzoquinol methylase